MKKNIFYSLIILTSLFAACKKENDVKPANSNETTTTESLKEPLVKSHKKISEL